MSGSAAKAVRRDIRRAFGEAGVAELEGLSGEVRTDISRLVQIQSADHIRLENAWKQIEALEQRLTALEERTPRWTTFSSRLRWLFLGRVA